MASYQELLAQRTRERQERTARLAKATAALQTINTQSKNEVNKSILERVIEDPLVKQSYKVENLNYPSVMKTFMQQDAKFAPRPEWNVYGHFPSEKYENLHADLKEIAKPTPKNPAAISFIGKGLKSAFGAAINVLEMPLEAKVAFTQFKVNLVQAALGTVGIGGGKWSDVWEDAWDNAKDLVPVYGGHLFYDDIFVNEDWFQGEFEIPKLGWNVRYSQIVSVPMDFILDPLNSLGGVGLVNDINRGVTAIGAARQVIRRSVDNMLDESIEKGLKYADEGLEEVVGAMDDITKSTLKSSVTNETREGFVDSIIQWAADAGDVSKAQIKAKVLEWFETNGKFKHSPSFSQGDSLLYNIDPKVASPLVDEAVDVIDVVIKAERFGPSSLSIVETNIMAKWAEKNNLMLYNGKFVDAVEFAAEADRYNDKVTKFTPFVNSGLTPQWGLKYRSPLSLVNLFNVVRGKTRPINLLGEGVVANSVYSMAQRIGNRLSTHTWDAAAGKFVKKAKPAVATKFQPKRIIPNARGINVSDRTWGKLMSFPQFFSQHVRQSWRKSRVARALNDLDMSGDLRQAKWDIANSTNPFKVHLAKELVTTVGRANAVKLQTAVRLRRLAKPFIDLLRSSSNELSGQTQSVLTKYGITVGEDSIYGSSYQEAFRILVTNAAEGSEEAAGMLNEIMALAREVNPSLYEGVDLAADMKRLFVGFADEAERVAGGQVVSRRENYIPHQLNKELRDELRAVAKSGKIKGQHRKFKRFSTGAPTLQRGYVDKVEFNKRFLEWMKRTHRQVDLTNAPESRLEKFKNEFRDSEGITDLFSDVQLHEPNFIDPETGKKYGSLAEQISEIMEHHGLSGNFFERDPLKFVTDYIEGLSRQTATTWSFNDLQKKGVISQAKGWVTSLELPRMKDIETSKSLLQRYRSLEFMQRRLTKRLHDAYEQSEEARKLTVKEIDELEKEASVLQSQIEELETRVERSAKLQEAKEAKLSDDIARLEEIEARKQELLNNLALDEWEKFKRNEITLKEMESFKRAVESNKELQELQEEMRKIIIGAGENPEDIADSFYARVWEGVTTGLSVRMILDELFETGFFDTINGTKKGTELAREYYEALINAVDDRLRIYHNDSLLSIAQTPEALGHISYQLSQEERGMFVTFAEIDETIVSLLEPLGPEARGLLIRLFAPNQTDDIFLMRNAELGTEIVYPKDVDLPDDPFVFESNNGFLVPIDSHVLYNLKAKVNEVHNLDLTDEEFFRALDRISTELGYQPKNASRHYGDARRSSDLYYLAEDQSFAYAKPTMNTNGDEIDPLVMRHYFDQLQEIKLDPSTSTLSEAEQARRAMEQAEIAVSTARDREINLSEWSNLSSTDSRFSGPENVERIGPNEILNTLERENYVITLPDGNSLSVTQIRRLFDGIHDWLLNDSIGEWLLNSRFVLDNIEREATRTSGGQFYVLSDALDAEIESGISRLSAWEREFNPKKSHPSAQETEVDSIFDLMPVPSVEALQDAQRRVFDGYYNNPDRTMVDLDPLTNSEVIKAAKLYFGVRGHRPLAQVDNLEDLGQMVNGYRKFIQQRIDEILREMSDDPLVGNVINSFIDSLGHVRLPTGETVNMAGAIAYMERFKEKGMSQAVFRAGFDDSFEITEEVVRSMEKVDPALVNGIGPESALPESSILNPENWDASEGYYQRTFTDKYGNEQTEYYLVKKFDNPLDLDKMFFAYKMYEIAGVQVPKAKKWASPNGTYLWLTLPTDSNGQLLSLSSVRKIADDPSGQRMPSELTRATDRQLPLLDRPQYERSEYVDLATAIDLLIGTPYNPIGRPRVMGDLGERLIRVDLGGVFFDGLGDVVDVGHLDFFLGYQIGNFNGRTRVGLGDPDAPISTPVTSGMGDAANRWEEEVIRKWQAFSNYDERVRAWEDYDELIVEWDKANPELAKQRKLYESGEALTEDQIRDQAIGTVVKRIRDRDGLFVNPNDVVSDYPHLIDDEIARINQLNQGADSIEGLPKRPEFDRPTGKRPDVKPTKRPKDLPEGITEDIVMERHLFEASGADTIRLGTDNFGYPNPEYVQALSNAVDRLDKFRLEQGGFRQLIRHILGNTADEALIAKLSYFMDVRLNAMSEALRGRPIALGTDEMIREAAIKAGIPEDFVDKTDVRKLVPIMRQFNRFHYVQTPAGQGFMIDVARQGSSPMDFEGVTMINPESSIQPALETPSLYSDSSSMFTLAPYAFMDVSSQFGLDGAGMSNVWQYLELDVNAGKIKTYGASPSQATVGEEIADRGLAAGRIHGGDVGEDGSNFFQWAAEDRLIRLALKRLYDPDNLHQIDMDDPFFWEKLENIAGYGPQYSRQPRALEGVRNYRQTPREVIPKGDRSLDILDRQTVSDIDEMIEYLLRDFLTMDASERQMFGLKKPLSKKEVESTVQEILRNIRANDLDGVMTWVPEAGYGHWVRNPLVSAEHSPHNPLYKFFMSDNEAQIAQVLHDRMSKANAIYALITARTLLSANSIIQKFPLKQKLGFREIFEFVAWRDLKYRTAMRSPSDNFIGEVASLEDDLAEYMMKTDPANPQLSSDNVDAKMLSYIYANQLLGRVEARDMINAARPVDMLMPRLVENWKASLIGDGYIAVATPTRAGSARVFNPFQDSQQWDQLSAMREQQVFPYNEKIQGTSIFEGEQPQQVPFGEGTTYPLEPRPDVLGGGIGGTFEQSVQSGISNKTQRSAGTYDDDWIVDLHVIDKTAVHMDENAFKIQLTDVKNAKMEVVSAIADAAMEVRNRILRIWQGIGTTNEEVEWLKRYMGSKWVDDYLGNWLKYIDDKKLDVSEDLQQALFDEAQKLADGIAVRVRDDELKALRDETSWSSNREFGAYWNGEEWIIPADAFGDNLDDINFSGRLVDPAERLESAISLPIRKALERFHSRMGRNDLFLAYLEDIGINYKTPQNEKAITFLEAVGWKGEGLDPRRPLTSDWGEVVDTLASVIEQEIFPEEWFEQWMRWRVNPNIDTAYDYLDARLRNALTYNDGLASKLQEVENFYKNPDKDELIRNREDLFRPDRNGVQRSIAQQEAAVEASKAQLETAQAAHIRARQTLEDAKSRASEIPERIAQLKDVEDWLNTRSLLLEEAMSSLEQLRLSFASANDSVMVPTDGMGEPLVTIPKAKKEFENVSKVLVNHSPPEELINDIDLSIRYLAQKDADLIDEIIAHAELGAKEYNQLLESPIDDRLPAKMKNLGEVVVRKHVSGQQPIGTGGGMSSGSLAMAMQESEEAISAALTNKGWVQHYDRVHNLMKGYMILKMGFMARNFYGGAWMNFLANVSPSDYTDFARAYFYVKQENQLLSNRTFRLSGAGASKQLEEEAKIVAKLEKKLGKVPQEHIEWVREMVNGGALGGAQTATEFSQTVSIGGRTINFGKVNPFNSGNFVLSGFRNMNVGVETMLRGANGFSVMRKGGTIDDAWDSIVKWHFDYADLSTREKKIKRLIPFYTWARRAIPLTFSEFFRQPAKFNTYFKIMNELDASDRILEEGIAVPTWMLRQGGIMLPEWFDIGGQPTYFMPDLPMRSLREWVDGPTYGLQEGGIKGALGAVLSQTGSMVTPLIKAPIEGVLHRNIWKGYSFQGNKRMEYVPKALRLQIPTLNIGMMDAMGALGLAEKHGGEWFMADNVLHAYSQFLPVFSDYRRLFPEEERYTQRRLSTFLSWFAGVGLRTVTPYEQEQAFKALGWETRETSAKQNRINKLLELYS